MSDNLQFKAMLELLIPSLVKTIITERGISEQDAITTLYSSALYDKLDDEATKLWHLSIPTLYDMLKEELATGKITYPEEA